MKQKENLFPKNAAVGLKASASKHLNPKHNLNTQNNFWKTRSTNKYNNSVKNTWKEGSVE